MAATLALWVGIVAVLVGTVAAVTTTGRRRESLLPAELPADADDYQGEETAARTRQATPPPEQARQAPERTPPQPAAAQPPPTAPEPSSAEAPREHETLNDLMDGPVAPSPSDDTANTEVYRFHYEVLGESESPQAMMPPFERFVLALNDLYANPPSDPAYLTTEERPRLLTGLAGTVGMRPVRATTLSGETSTLIWAAAVDEGPDRLAVLLDTLFTDALLAAFLDAPTGVNRNATMTVAETTLSTEAFVVRTVTTTLGAILNAHAMNTFETAFGEPGVELVNAVLDLLTRGEAAP